MWSVLSRYVGQCPSNPSQCYWTLVRNKMLIWIRLFLERIKRLEAKSISLFGRQCLCRIIENYCRRGLLNQLSATLHKEFTSDYVRLGCCTCMFTIIICKQIFESNMIFCFSSFQYLYICLRIFILLEN